MSKTLWIIAGIATVGATVGIAYALSKPSNKYQGSLTNVNKTLPTPGTTVFYANYTTSSGVTLNLFSSYRTVTYTGITYWSDYNGGSGEFIDLVSLLQWIDTKYPWAYGGTNVHYT